MMMKILETLPVLRSVFCDQQQPPIRSPIYKAGLGGCKHPPLLFILPPLPRRRALPGDTTHTLHRRRRKNAPDSPVATEPNADTFAPLLSYMTIGEFASPFGRQQGRGGLLALSPCLHW